MALGFHPGPFTPTRNVFRPGSRSGFNVEVKGLDKMIKSLDRRVLRMQQTILRQAVLAFAEPIRADAERRARSLISPSVEIATEVKIRGTTATVKIGPLVSPGKKFVGPFRDAFWLFFFEYGYWIRATRKGPGIKWVEKRPTMRPAYDAHKEEGLRAMEKILFDAFSDEAIAA